MVPASGRQPWAGGKFGMQGNAGAEGGLALGVRYRGEKNLSRTVLRKGQEMKLNEAKAMLRGYPYGWCVDDPLYEVLLQEARDCDTRAEFIDACDNIVNSVMAVAESLKDCEEDNGADR